MKKRFFALMLALVVLVTALPVHAVSAPTFCVDTVSAEAGDTLDIYIRLQNNPGVASVKLNVTYAPELTLTGVEYNEALGGVTMLPETMNSPAVLNWLNFLDNTTGDMYFAKLTFLVSANAKVGTYPVTISYEADNVYNIDEENLSFAIENGGVKVVNCLHRNKTTTEAKASDCKTQGWDAYKTCKKCNQLFDMADQPINAIPLRPLSNAHTGGTATCEKQAVCTVCGASYGELNSHKYTSVVTKPTCTEDGYTTHTCSVCQHSYKDSTVKAPGHKYASVVTKPTCTEDGYTTHTCSVCQHSYKDSAVKAPGHKYASVVTKPTCTEGGYTTHTCAACSDVYVDNRTNPTGHASAAPVRENETKNSYDEVEYCKHCGTELSRKFVLIYTPGDINGDGKINNKDASLLFQHVSGWDVDVNMNALDINNDGKVNNKDASRLFQYVSGWDVEIY